MTPPMTTLPVPNLPLLRKVLSHIDSHPEEWDQHTWGLRTVESDCGTAFCVAGHALNMSGEHECIFRKDEYGEVRFYIDGHDADNVAANLARHELGLTVQEAADLFSGGNGRIDVQFYAARIAARAGEVL